MSNITDSRIYNCKDVLENSPVGGRHMDLVTETKIRDFKIRGNYLNRRSSVLRRDLHALKKDAAPNHPGYSPPVVDFELMDGTTHSTSVSEADIPLLSDDDSEKARRFLSLILEARHGQLERVEELSATVRKSESERTRQIEPHQKPLRCSLHQLSAPF